MISVIVPVYNVERYLEECLNSIQQQSYTDIEVILVNDGSTDHSKTICERYCEEDSRFYLLNQTNQGQSSARNVGVAASKGEFIAFVDSDDIIQKNYLEKLMQYMTEEVDIVESNFTVSKKDFLVENSKETTILFEGNSEEAIIESCNYGLSYSPVVKLYRRNLLENFPFLNGVIFEDIYHGVGILKFIRKMVKIDYVGYHYRERSNSTMHRKFSKKNLDVFISSDKLVELFSSDKKLSPYIGKFLVQIVTTHHNYFTEKINPYQSMYEEKLKQYVAIVEESPEVARSSKMIRMYKLAPSLYLRYTFPFVYKTWGRLKHLKELVIKGE